MLHGASGRAAARPAGNGRAPRDDLEELLSAFRDQGLLDDGGDGHDRPGTDLPPHPDQPHRSGSGRGPADPTPARTVPPDSPYARARVHLEGDTPVAEVLAGRLASLATLTRGPVTADGLRGVDVLLSCGGWLTDERWQRLDRWCGGAGVAWHTTHAEGQRLVVGPCVLPGAAPRYHDTRARLLAAAPFPDELSWLWRALDGDPAAGTPLPPVPRPCPGAQETAVDLVLADVRAVLDGGRPPGTGIQTVVDARTGTASRHAVRPLPDLAAPTW